MALETEDDYQDKIDDLNKEIEKLYDEGTDKGFKLKREEEMDQEQRALKTEDDYQREYDKIKSQIKTYNTNLAKIEAEIKKLDEEADAIAESIFELTKKGLTIAKEGESKGFKVKRGEYLNFEARKQEVINKLEVRALKTQKDYQQEIDDWAEQVEDRLEKVKFAEEDAKYWKNEAKADAKSMEKVYKEGIAKGFKLKMKTFKF